VPHQGGKGFAEERADGGEMSRASTLIVLAVAPVVAGRRPCEAVPG
jgi:hypothetical protein